MRFSSLLLLLVTPLIVPDQPRPPAWAPDHQILATTKLPELFVTPEGGNYTVYFNGKAVYPKKPKHNWFNGYRNQHTFLSDLVWSPDSRHLALLEKVYDWEYTDPYNRSFDGTLFNRTFFLAIISRDGSAVGYTLSAVPDHPDLRWQSPNQLMLNDRLYDLQAKPPQPIR